ADAQNVLILYASGDGNDFIAGFDGNDTMSIAGGKYSSAVSGDDVVLTVGRGKVTLSDAASLGTLNIVGGSDTTPANKGIYVENSVDNTLITGTAYGDSIVNSGRRVTINGLAGNDYIVNDVDSSVTTSAVANLIDAGAGNDTIFNYHSYQPTLLGGDGNDSIVVSRGHMTYIDGGAGNDSIIGRTTDTTDSSDWAMGGYATILGGDGNDYINPFYTNNSTIDGGSGNDTIIMMGADSTITGSTGNDQISLGTADSVNVWINYASGDGNDVINGFTENDTVSIGGAKYYSVASGNDLILTVGNGHMTLRGAATLEDINIIGSYDEAADSIISNSTNAASVIGTSGNDTITNTGARATIQALAGNDSIISDASSVLLFGGAGNDSIYASGRNTTIDAGAGSNLVSVTGSQGLYVVFDGNTTVDGFNTGFGSGADTILINGDAPSVNFRTDGLTFYNGSQSVLLNGVTSTAKLHLYYADSSYSAEVFIADNDLYKVTDNDLRQNNLYFVGATASHNHGIDFSDITRSLNVTLDTDYGATPTFWVNNIYSIVGGAGNTTITGSDENDTIIAGSGNTTINAGGGNDNIALNSSRAIVNYSSGDGNDFIAGFNANSTLRISGDSYSTVESGNNVIVSVGSGNVTLDGAASLDSLNIIGTVDGGGGSIDANTEVYGGGDQTIASYAGQPVVLITDYKGALFDGNNFVVYSSDGALTIQDVTDKVIDLRDSSGNETLKAYTASTAGVIDGRGLAGYEIISGAANGTDIIYAGDGGSMLWGGAGTAADALLGGEGVDTFIAGRNQGMDNIFSAGVEDIVNLNDASLSDIVATAEVEGNKILVGFNTGNVIAVQSADEISATFKLADGSTHTYNHTTKTWQSA
ncbi:MAG: calcium-binding protein, partial [Selenomonadaceae bacterium]|nr:calcium-binding protein [Selenomonadaceae bacterium]